MKHYEILESFAYQRFTPEGLVEGEFHPGVTGDDLNDEQIAVLEEIAVPNELARYADAPAPAAAAKPAPTPAPAPEAQPEQEKSA